MSRIKDKDLEDIAYSMGPYFTPIVMADGVLTNEKMKPALTQAWKDGVIKHHVSSERSLRLVEEFYSAQ